MTLAEMSTQTTSSNPSPTIFSSDGLPPIPNPQHPQQSRPTTAHEAVIDTLDESEPPPPHDAFEVFSGKVFQCKERTVGQTTLSVAKETTIERLTRIKREIDLLEADLSSSHFSSDADILKLTRELSSRLSIDPTSRQNILSSVVRDNLEEMKSPSSIPRPEKEQVDDSITTIATTSALEERLGRMERIIGGSSRANITHRGTLLERLEKAEELVRGVDSKALEQAANRAKIIRADWEAASKTRSKVASIASASPEETKIISTLYDNMTSLESVSNQLPLVVKRLGELSSLHLRASNFETRLESCEKNVDGVERLLDGLEKTLQMVESSCLENLNVMEKNLEGFEGKLMTLKGEGE